MTTLGTRQHVSYAQEHCLWRSGGQDGLGEGTTEDGEKSMEGGSGLRDQTGHRPQLALLPGARTARQDPRLPSIRAAFLMAGAGSVPVLWGCGQMLLSGVLLCLSEALGRGPTWSPKRTWTFHSSSRVRVSGTGRLAERHLPPCALPPRVINPQPTCYH